MMSFAVLAAALAAGALMPTGIAERLFAQGSRPLRGQVPISDPDDDDERVGEDDDEEEDDDEDEDDEEPWQVHPAGAGWRDLVLTH